jgi:hypothetical protein
LIHAHAGNLNGSELGGLKSDRRLILTLSHFTSWRYVRYLSYCIDRHLLERVSALFEIPARGRDRFIHHELLEHLAQDTG